MGEAGEKYERALFVSPCSRVNKYPPALFQASHSSPHLLTSLKYAETYSLWAPLRRKRTGISSWLIQKFWTKPPAAPDVRLRTAQLYFHISKTRPHQRHLHIACTFIFWQQPSGEERQRRNKWGAQGLVMSTTAPPSSLPSPVEVCCHIWISVSHVLSCTLQSKPGALHSLSGDNQKRDEFMTKLV